MTAIPKPLLVLVLLLLPATVAAASKHSVETKVQALMWAGRLDLQFEFSPRDAQDFVEGLEISASAKQQIASAMLRAHPGLKAQSLLARRLVRDGNLRHLNACLRFYNSEAGRKLVQRVLHLNTPAGYAGVEAVLKQYDKLPEALRKKVDTALTEEWFDKQWQDTKALTARLVEGLSKSLREGVPPDLARKLVAEFESEALGLLARQEADLELRSYFAYMLQGGDEAWQAEVMAFFLSETDAWLERHENAAAVEAFSDPYYAFGEALGEALAREL